MEGAVIAGVKLRVRFKRGAVHVLAEGTSFLILYYS
jgi:hypothetical protein